MTTTLTDMASTIDMLGQEYKVGDYVVYATTSGRSPVMKFASVERIASRMVPRYRFNQETRKQETFEVEEIRVGVREIANGRNFSRWDTRKSVYEDGQYVGIKKVPARVTYPMVENIIAVTNKSQIANYLSEKDTP